VARRITRQRPDTAACSAPATAPAGCRTDDRDPDAAPRAGGGSGNGETQRPARGRAAAPRRGQRTRAVAPWRPRDL